MLKQARIYNVRETFYTEFAKDIIHLLPSFEGDMKICSYQKIHVFWVEQVFMSPD